MKVEVADLLTGVICATVTPFDEADHQVDWDGVRGNADWLIDHRVSVLVVNGSIGEYPSLTREERYEAVRATAAAAAGRVPVVAGASDTALVAVGEHCQQAADAGADAVMILPPPYFRLSPDEVLDFYRAVDAVTPLPFVVYNNPSITGYDIGIDTIGEIAGLARFVGLKEASPDVMRFYELIDRYGTRFPVITASEPPLLFTLVAGSPGCLTAAAAFAPELLDALVAAVARSDLTEARQLFARLYDFRRLLQPEMRAGRPAYIPYTKAAMNLVGLRGGVPRPPLRPLDAAARQALRTSLTDALGLRTTPDRNHS